MDIKNRPRIPIPDEDPYSIASSNANGSGSSGSSGYGHGNGHGVVAATREQLLMQMERGQRRGDKPPKLPPRENGYGPADIPKVRKVVIPNFTFSFFYILRYWIRLRITYIFIKKLYFILGIQRVTFTEIVLIKLPRTCETRYVATASNSICYIFIYEIQPTFALHIELG